MSVVGHHENLIACDRYSAVDAAGGIADEPLGAGALEMPDLAACAGIERVTFVGAGNVHDAIGNDRRHLKAASVGQIE